MVQDFIKVDFRGDIMLKSKKFMFNRKFYILNYTNEDNYIKKWLKN